MGIPLASNFDVNAALPLDSRMTVVDLVARDAILAGRRFDGMVVYVEADLTSYQLQGGITNGDWTAFGAGASVPINYAVDRFSGTGAQVAFTLGADPGSENNVQVYVSGVYQQKDTYSVATTTLTFSTAPPTGTDNIEVVRGDTVAIGTPSDATVTTAKLVDGSVTTPKIADGAVTKAKLASLGQQISASCGAWVNSGTAEQVVTNLSVTITTTGRPVWLGLKTDTTTATTQFGMYASSTTTTLDSILRIRRGGAAITSSRLLATYPTTSGFNAIYYPLGSINTIDVGAAAGTHTYDITVESNSLTTTVVTDAKLVAYEL